MRRPIRSDDTHEAGRPEPFRAPPGDLFLTFDPAVNRCELTPDVRAGQPAAAGDAIARGDRLCVHAPLTGTVIRADETGAVIHPDSDQPPPGYAAPERPDADSLPAFAADMGLAGMGGSMFPTSVKLNASRAVDTLAVNAVECEPGIEIDQALLVYENERVQAGIELLRAALNLRRIVIAAQRPAVPRLRARIEEPDREWLAMPPTYPAGAERLIVERLTGRLPPAGKLPFAYGILVMSPASLWALGRRIQEGRPSLDRPLTFAASGQDPVNVIAPLGMSFGALLDGMNTPYDPDTHLLIAGGLMMGRRVTPTDHIQKGTNAVFIRPKERRLKKAEEPCVLCGSCFDACPLHLHPIGMAERINARRDSRALRAHVKECFLCGACSAVCPADIPLVQYFHEGKQWLKEKK